MTAVRFPRWARGGAAVALVCVGLVAPAFATDKDLPPNETILRNFEIIAFGNEHTGLRYDHVRKWVDPIRLGIQVGYDYPDYFEQFVRQHAEDLRRLTGHPVELYYSPKMAKAKRLPAGFDRNKVNVILFYAPVKEVPKAIAKYFKNDMAEIAKMIRTSQCFARYWTRKNEIRSAIVIFFAEETQERTRQCVIEELTQLLGLANDSDQVNPSIFNDRSPYIDLTKHDRLMVRLLYDKRIMPGMPRAEALKVSRQILRELRPE
jgi:hypothetical protein